MKFTTSSIALREALASVDGVISAQKHSPILECALFEQDGDRLCLSATDLGVSIVKRIDVYFDDQEGVGRIAVPVRQLLDTLRALPDLPVTFSATPEFFFTLSTDQGTYKMSGFDGSDYPDLQSAPTGPDAAQVATTGGAIRRALAKTGFAVGTDKSRLAMTGIYFQITPEGGRVVSTDGHRLIRFQDSSLVSTKDLGFIVPKKALVLTARVVSEGPCILSVSTSHVSFDFEDARIVAALIAARYPNYEKVIPTDNDKQCIVHRENLLSALQRVSIYASFASRQITMEFADNEIRVAAEDVERASRANEVVMCDYKHDKQAMGFNGDYVVEVLKNLESEYVVLHLGPPIRAGLVTPLDQPEGEDHVLLIMPVMLRNYA